MMNLKKDIRIARPLQYQKVDFDVDELIEIEQKITEINIASEALLTILREKRRVEWSKQHPMRK